MKTIIRQQDNYLSEWEKFNQFFDQFIGGPVTRMSHPETTYLPIDLLELEGNLVVKAALPGVSPNEMDITVEDNILTISAEVKNQHEAGDAKVYHQEYRYGSFTRSIRLPKDLNLDAIKAEFNNGLVTITIPKLEAPKPKSIKIPVMANPELGSKVTNVKSETKRMNP